MLHPRRLAGDSVQFHHGFRRERHLTGSQVLAEVGDRGGARDKQDIGRPVQQPRQGCQATSETDPLATRILTP